MMFKSCLLASFLLSQVLCQTSTPVTPSSLHCVDGQSNCYCKDDWCYGRCVDWECQQEDSSVGSVDGTIIPDMPICEEGEGWCLCGDEECYTRCINGTCKEIEWSITPEIELCTEGGSFCDCGGQYCYTECNNGTCNEYEDFIEDCEEGGTECICGTEPRSLCAFRMQCKSGVCVFENDYLDYFQNCTKEHDSYCRCGDGQLCFSGRYCVDGVCLYDGVEDDGEDGEDAEDAEDAGDGADATGP